MAVFLARIVMPRSRSSSFESMTRSTTSWLALKIPLCQSMASTRVVLPWSTCAMMAMLRIESVMDCQFSRFDFRAAGRLHKAGSGVIDPSSAAVDSGTCRPKDGRWQDSRLTAETLWQVQPSMLRHKGEFEKPRRFRVSLLWPSTRPRTLVMPLLTRQSRRAKRFSEFPKSFQRPPRTDPRNRRRPSLLPKSSTDPVLRGRGFLHVPQGVPPRPELQEPRNGVTIPSTQILLGEGALCSPGCSCSQAEVFFPRP